MSASRDIDIFLYESFIIFVCDFKISIHVQKVGQKNGDNEASG
jgi:hypothetical protein